MDPSTESDARLLWDDAVGILSGAGASPQLLKMAASCVPLDYSGSTVTVAAPSGFAGRVLERERPALEGALSQAAFEPVTLAIDGARRESAAPVATQAAPTSQTAPEALAAPQAPANAQVPLAQTPATATPQVVAPTVQPAPEATGPQGPDLSSFGHRPTITMEEYLAIYGRGSNKGDDGADRPRIAESPRVNPLVTACGEGDATLTFDTFVEADENRFALQAAKQVANGSTAYNPLFIHGSSGLGKTHLLRAIQNYIAVNDPERQCVYRVASDFRDDYVSAMRGGDNPVKENLARYYRDIDVLILDDIQHIASAQGTMGFFFDTFNYLVEHGKQIVLAADVPPAEIGMDERFTSRMLQGIPVAVQPPSLEFKRILIETFYRRMREEGNIEAAGVLTPDDLALMAERAGGNIRSIRGFVQKCMFTSTALAAEGRALEPADIVAAAAEIWPAEGLIVSIEDIQSLVQTAYSVSRQDLVSSKRNKEIVQPRHVAIYLARELTDSTLEEIGRKFGDRSHATVKHSIGWVEDHMRSDRVFHDQVARLRERLGGM